MKITDEYLAIWADQNKREAKRRPLSADEETFGALVTEVQRWRRIAERDHGAPIETVEKLRSERDGARMVLDAMSCRVEDLGRERDALLDEVERLRAQLLAAEVANHSLIPGAMLTATEIECLRVERDGARCDRDAYRAMLCNVLAEDLAPGLRNYDAARELLKNGPAPAVEDDDE